MFSSCDIFSVIWTALVLCGSPTHLWNGTREGVWVSEFNSTCMKKFLHFYQFKPDLAFENLTGRNFSLSKEQIKDCIKVCKIPNHLKNDFDLRKINFSSVNRSSVLEISKNITSNVSRSLFDSNLLPNSSSNETCDIDFTWHSYKPFNSYCCNNLHLKDSNFSKEIDTSHKDEQKISLNDKTKENFLPVVWYRKSNDKCYLSSNRNQSFQISKEKITNRIKDLSLIKRYQPCRNLNLSIIHQNSTRFRNNSLKKTFQPKLLSCSSSSSNYLRYLNNLCWKKKSCRFIPAKRFSKKKISLNKDISKYQTKGLHKTFWNNTKSYKQKFCESRNLYECSLEPINNLLSNDSEC